MKLYRVALKKLVTVYVNPRECKLVLIWTARVLENMLDVEDPVVGREVPVIFPYRFTNWKTRPSEELLARLVDPSEFWEALLEKSGRRGFLGRLAECESPEDVKKVVAEEVERRLSGKVFLVAAVRVCDLMGNVSLYAARVVPCAGRREAERLAGDIQKLRSLVYDLSRLTGYEVVSEVESTTHAFYVLLRKRKGLQHAIHLSFPMFARGEAYRIWATVNGVVTYPLRPRRITVYGAEYWVPYESVPHVKGYLAKIREKVLEAIGTFDKQAELYERLATPVTEEELSAVLSELPGHLSRKLQVSKQLLVGRALTWAGLVKSARERLSDPEVGCLLVVLLDKLGSEPVRVEERLTYYV